MSEQDEAEKLLQQSKEQKRHRTEPSTSAPDDSVTLEDAVADAYRRLEGGEAHENLTIRDRDLAALFAALDETGGLAEVGTDAAGALDRDESPTSKAGVLGILARVGLREVAPARIEAAKDGKREYLASQADEF